MYTLAVVAGYLLYFMPTYVATFRKVKHQNKIATLNWLVGWTLIGWILLLAWSFKDIKMQTV